jgi:hypothetical protein
MTLADGSGLVDEDYDDAYDVSVAYSLILNTVYISPHCNGCSLLSQYFPLAGISFISKMVFINSLVCNFRRVIEIYRRYLPHFNVKSTFYDINIKRMIYD